jgi:S-adenosylmethionine:tRNA ribosyltransferase-isomerase
MYSPNDYDFALPEELIAQQPEACRDESRLLVLSRRSGSLSHRKFNELCEFLSPGDVLVVNDTRVVPARLVGKKETGGRVEVLILDYARAVGAVSDNGSIVCQCLVKTARPARPGTRVFFDRGLAAEIGGCAEGVFSVTFSCDDDFGGLLEEIGSVPLPPYIHRKGDTGRKEDMAAYQTVYAVRNGAAAAPTAGLHFTQALLEKVRAIGVTVVSITLHVGYGTFRPVKAADIREHPMHSEDYTIPDATANTLNQARSEGRRVLAVGTTCVRTLEYASNEEGRIISGSGQCDLFIYPGYRFRMVDAMITNFHLPKSTLMMLVAAFVGRERALAAYREAVERRYRFFSYGDAMMIV